MEFGESPNPREVLPEEVSFPRPFVAPEFPLCPGLLVPNRSVFESTITPTALTCMNRHFPFGSMGSAYSCRRKRIVFVCSSSSTLAGYRLNWRWNRAMARAYSVPRKITSASRSRWPCCNTLGRATVSPMSRTVTVIIMKTKPKPTAEPQRVLLGKWQVDCPVGCCILNRHTC